MENPTGKTIQKIPTHNTLQYLNIMSSALLQVDKTFTQMITLIYARYLTRSVKLDKDH